MSLLTRCPACSTIYRIVPDQLRISQGWVKCGQCGDIFDATQHLVEIEPETTLAAPEPPVAPLEHTVTAVASSTRTQLDEVFDPDPTNADIGGDASDTGPTMPDPTTSDTSTTAGLAPTDSSAEPARIVLRESPIDPEPQSEPAPDPMQTAQESATFLRDDAASAHQPQRWTQTVMMLLAVGLTGMLATQAIYHNRHWLHAAYAPARPVLQAACEALGCDLAPVQNIDAVMIDAAAFNQLEDGRYLLSCDLKNTAAWPVAAPSLELTLNDLQDRVVVRRVFLSHELDAQVSTLSPGSPWHVRVPLTLTLQSHAPAVVGYRVRAFYP